MKTMSIVFPSDTKEMSYYTEPSEEMSYYTEPSEEMSYYTEPSDSYPTVVSQKVNKSPINHSNCSLSHWHSFIYMLHVN